MTDIDCSCDYDPPTLYRADIVRARKRYKCCECDGVIEIGERYEYVFGLWEGYTSTHKTCERCRDLRTWVKNNVPCLCIMHGNQDEENENAIDEAYRRAASEVVGLRFGYLRRRALRDTWNIKVRNEKALVINEGMGLASDLDS